MIWVRIRDAGGLANDVWSSGKSPKGTESIWRRPDDGNIEGGKRVETQGRPYFLLARHTYKGNLLRR